MHGGAEGGGGAAGASGGGGEGEGYSVRWWQRTPFGSGPLPERTAARRESSVPTSGVSVHERSVGAMGPMEKSVHPGAMHTSRSYVTLPSVALSDEPPRTTAAEDHTPEGL